MNDAPKSPSQPGDPHHLVNSEEIAKVLGVSAETIERRVRKKTIPHIRMGRKVVRFHVPTVLLHYSIKPVK